MPASMIFPEVRLPRFVVPMYRTPWRPTEKRGLDRLARELNVEGESREMGSRTEMSGSGGVLEVFSASDSIRWTDAGWNDTDLPPRGELPSKKKAMATATEFLRRTGLLDERMKRYDIDEQLVSVRDVGKEAATDYPVALQVGYRFEIEAYPVFGPGAKCKVVIDASGQVRECLKFWREPTAEKGRRLVDVAEATELIRTNQLYRRALRDRVKITFHTVQFGYYALPPRERQGYLIPVYRYRGVVETPTRRRRLTHLVLAVKASPEEIKEAMAVAGHDVCIDIPQRELYRGSGKKRR